MKTNLVGARELKARLGSYLRRVRQGQTIVVTDRGQPVAELRPLSPGSEVEAVLAALTASGAVTRSRARALPPFRPIEGSERLAESAVIEDRADRI